jgi:predicted ABC-type ATPase
MGRAKPHAIFLARPNGSGKSTAAPALLRDYLGVTEFINADTIAAGLSAFRPESAALQASAVLLERVEELVSQRRSFAVETTLASKSYAARIPVWQAVGFRVDLHFLWLPSVELAIQRVSSRVRAGGHSIPETTIRRRFVRGLRNFREMYRLAVDRWMVYNAALDCGPIRIAHASEAQVEVEDRPEWEHFESQVANA